MYSAHRRCVLLPNAKCAGFTNTCSEYQIRRHLLLRSRRRIRTALMKNFRHKLETNEDIAVEGVVGLFHRAWRKQQTLAIFGDDENAQAIGSTGEELVSRYMQQ